MRINRYAKRWNRTFYCADNWIRELYSNRYPSWMLPLSELLSNGRARWRKFIYMNVTFDVIRLFDLESGASNSIIIRLSSFLALSLSLSVSMHQLPLSASSVFTLGFYDDGIGPICDIVFSIWHHLSARSTPRQRLHDALHRTVQTPCNLCQSIR